MIYFLFGSDTFRSQEKLKQIKNKFLQKENSGADLSLLDFGEKISLEKIKESFSAGNLFSPKKLVILSQTIKLTTPDFQKEVLALIKKDAGILEETDRILVFWEEVPKKTGALFKYLFKNAKKQEFELLEGQALNKWALEKMQSYIAEAKFQGSALSLLTASTGSDLYLLGNEICKLASYISTSSITEADINAMVRARFDSNIFETVEAMLGKNKGRALELFHQQIEKGEDVFYIFSMYVYQIRNLLKVSEFASQRMPNNYAIAKETKLHPYVVQKCLAQLRNVPAENIKNAYSKLEQIDIAVKTGKTDLLTALDLFLTSI
jgi:DNA polymerase-3 subunit delta